MGRTKTMHARRSTCLPGGCAALAWPEGAVVAAVMAPAEGKNGNSGSFPPRRAPLRWLIFRFPYVNLLVGIPFIKFIKFDEFFSELLRAHAAHALRVSEATEIYDRETQNMPPTLSPTPLGAQLGAGSRS